MRDRTACYEDLEQPQKRGQATEAIVQAAFALRDVPVLVPTYSDEPYDLVVEVGGRLHRIQCRTAYRKTESTVAFETAGARRRACERGQPGAGRQAEYIAVYDPGSDARYLVPVAAVTGREMELRVREPTDDARTGIDWASEYLLEDRLAELRRP